MRYVLLGLAVTLAACGSDNTSSHGGDVADSSVVDDTVGGEDTVPGDTLNDTGSADDTAPSEDTATADTTAVDTTPADPCSPNPCDEPLRTVCTAAGEAYTCACDPGAHEEGGACVADEACQDGTCHHHGQCADDGGVVSCDCATGWTGDYCDACDEAEGWWPDGQGGCTADPCDPNPCTEPGRTACTHDGPTVTCACDPGRHDEGGACVPDVECGPGSCAGHGDCTSDGLGITCACAPGYDGATCASCASGWHADGAGGCTQDPCTPNPCVAVGQTTCSTGDGGAAVCTCDDDYHPDGAGCALDEVCGEDSCGHGDCSVVGGLVTCACEPGWAAPGCDDCAAGWHDDGSGGCTQDPCLPNPCTDAGRTVCTANGASHVCACDDGLHEDGVGGCTDDPCLPHPCDASQACREAGGQAECYTPQCDDDNPCTDDAYLDGACHFEDRGDGAPCSDTVCTSGQTCTGGVCGGGEPVDCADDDPCTVDTCVDPTGCAHDVDEDIVPSDGVTCTVDSCAGGIATHIPDDDVCGASWCAGTGTCAPTELGSDADGCLRDGAPAPPGPSSTCLTWVCDEGTQGFSPVVAAAGTACDDHIGCTTGDACDGAGACVGAVTASCDAATCEGTVPFPDIVDLATARVVGSVTLDGGALPATQPGSDGDVTFYARARDTGARHSLGYLRYRYTAPGVYALYDTDGQLDTRLLPGVYDILYYRNYSSSNDYTYTDDPDDPYVNGYRVLRESVVIGPGLNHLDLDLGRAHVTGTVKLAGAALPPTQPGSDGDVTFYARAKDTGARHSLGYLRYRYVSSGVCDRRAARHAALAGHLRHPLPPELLDLERLHVHRRPS